MSDDPKKEQLLKPKEPKKPFSEVFGEWLHHKPTGPDDEDTYCGTRNSKKWKAILTFYFFFYGALVIFWVINYQAMFANIPALVGGSGPTVNEIQDFGYTRVIGANPDYSVIAADDGSRVFTGTGAQAFGDFRGKLTATEASNLQSSITTVTGQSGNQFLWNNCTGAVNGCSAASNYGTFGPIYLVTYRNRKWNRPENGASCGVTCTFLATFLDGTTNTGTITDNHFWKLNYVDGTWANGDASLECSPFQNQPGYRVFTAVSTMGYTQPVASYQLSCSVNDLGEEPSGGIKLTYVA